MNIFAHFAGAVAEAAASFKAEGGLPADFVLPALSVEPAKDRAHGDLASNAAMVLAKPARMKPRDLAEALAARLAKHPDIVKVDVAGPGFINMTLARPSGSALPAPFSRKVRTSGNPSSARRARQRRIRLGQSDRADACRPLPRRGLRRCARHLARLRRLRRDARILHQRCRRTGRRARALGLPALPRGAGRRHRRHPGRALPRRLPEAGRRSAGQGARPVAC